MERKHRHSSRNRIRLAGWRWMVAAATVPTISFYLLWVFIPVTYTFVMSFFNWRPQSLHQEFVGLANYVRVFFQDPLSLTTLRNTFYYTLVTIPATTFLSLIVAVMINSLPRGKALFRTLYFLPVVTSIVATSIMWKWLYQDRFGLINQVIKLALVDTLGFKINPFIQWLTSNSLAMPSIMAMSIWQTLGFNMVLFLAGLTSIPQVFYDAAKIDGAGRCQVFRHITIPLLRPTTIFVVATGMINGMQVITPMYVMTQGGPANATKSIVLHLYEKAFFSYLFGYASAIAFVLFVIIFLLTLIQLRIMRTSWEY